MIENFLGYIAINSIGKVLMKLSYREFPFQHFFVIESFFGIILWGVYGILNNANFLTVLSLIPISFLSALLSEFFVFYAYTKGDLNIIDSVFSIYPLFTILFSFLILGEKLPTSFLLALSLILLGIITISFRTNIRLALSNKAAFWAIAAAIAVGISDTLSKLFIDNYSSYEFIFSLGISQIILSCGILTRSRNTLRLNSIDRKTLTGAFLIALSMIFFWETFNSTFASIASTLTGSVVIATVLLSKLILKEDIPRKNYIGIAAIIIGVLIIRI